jgi:hypothetical protein
MEAALLFWIGKRKNIRAYEYMSYPLMITAFFSLTQDWSIAYSRFSYNKHEVLKPILNSTFLNSVLFLASSGFNELPRGRAIGVSKQT